MNAEFDVSTGVFRFDNGEYFLPRLTQNAFCELEVSKRFKLHTADIRSTFYDLPCILCGMNALFSCTFEKPGLVQCSFVWKDGAYMRFGYEAGEERLRNEVREIAEKLTRCFSLQPSRQKNNSVSWVCSWGIVEVSYETKSGSCITTFNFNKNRSC
jgi:hypothetical protein